MNNNNTFTNIVIVIILVLIVGFGVWYLTGRTAPTPTTQESGGIHVDIGGGNDDGMPDQGSGDL